MKITRAFILHGVFVLAVLAMLYIQFQRDTAAKLDLIAEESQQAAEQFDFVVKTTTDQIRNIRIRAEAFLRRTSTSNYTLGGELATLLKPSPYFDGFAIETNPEGVERLKIGNLNGLGDLADLSSDTLREIDMAYRLNSTFHAAVEAIPNLAWVYYTSARKFQNILPWVSTAESRFEPSILDLEFYTFGLPQNNPARQTFWTSAYVDTYGRGLMVTGGTPIYEGDTFLGTAAVDVTLDELSEFIRKNQISQGVAFVANEMGQIIAHPTLARSNALRTYALSDVLPKLEAADITEIQSVPFDQFTNIGNHDWVIRHKIEGAPWEFYAYIPNSELISAAAADFAPTLFIAILLFMSALAFERMRNANKMATAANSKLSDLSQQLSHYLSPQIYQSIFEGRQAASISTKRKELTVFFSDIKDFTATTENLQPEELNDLLNDYLTKMTEIALEYGATVDKYVGDAILVFFGDPASDGVEQDARKCLRMAIAMQRRMVDLRAKWIDMGYTRPIHMRIGINTGYCNVGNFGSEVRMDYTIIGAEVNLAARLESICDTDGIFISGRTYQFVKNEVDASPQDPIQVKGIANPITPYRVNGIFDDLDKDRKYIRAESDKMRLFIDLRDLTEDDKNQIASELEGKVHVLRNHMGEGLE